MRPDEHPNWVPPAVARSACDLFAVATSTDEKALIQRLLTDERMEGVWRELMECPTWPHDRRKRSPDDRQVYVDTALGLFFFSAYYFAHTRIKIETTAERRDAIKEQKRLAQSLRTAAKQLREFGAPDVKGTVVPHVAAIENAAAYLEEETERVYDDADPWLVKRDQGERQAGAYVRLLATKAFKNFDKVTDETIRTVMSVALEKDVAMHRVRDWCKSIKE